MQYVNEQQNLSAKLSAMPKEIADKAVQALGSFASGFLSGYQAAKDEQKAESAQAQTVADA